MLLNETLFREMVNTVTLQSAIDAITASLHTAVAAGDRVVYYDDDTVIGTDCNCPMINLIRAHFEEQGLRTEVYHPGEKCDGHDQFAKITVSICLNTSWWMSFRY